MKYKPGGYTGFLTAGQIPSFCSIRKHIVVIFAHANRLLVMDYRHTATSISGKYITRILVNLKSASAQKHHQKVCRWNFDFAKNALPHNHKLVQAIAEQCEFEELSHPGDSIDQTSSEYCLI